MQIQILSQVLLTTAVMEPTKEKGRKGHDLHSKGKERHCKIKDKGTERKRTTIESKTRKDSVESETESKREKGGNTVGSKEQRPATGKRSKRSQGSQKKKLIRLLKKQG